MSAAFAHSRQIQCQDFIEGVLDFLLESTEDLLEDNVFFGYVLKLCSMVDDPSFTSFNEVEGQMLISSDNIRKKDIIQRLRAAHANIHCCKEFLLPCVDNIAPAAELTHVFDERPRLLNENVQRIQISSQKNSRPCSIQRKGVIVASIIPHDASFEGDKAKIL